MRRKELPARASNDVPGLGARILKLRRERGWSTTVLAARLVERGCRVGSTRITSLENGAREGMSVATIRALADVLDTTTDYLLGRTTDPTPRR
jgi:transcriptional regulator with XRE-family HTH domain